MAKNENKYLVAIPDREVGARRKDEIKGRQIPSMTFVSNRLAPGSNMYLEFGWIWDIPTPNPHINEHSHDFDEVLLHIGTDMSNPQDLGAEIEISVEGEKVLIDKTCAFFFPKGVKHGPLVWKKVDRPHLEMALLIGAGSLEQANPGGSLSENKQAGQAEKKDESKK